MYVTCRACLRHQEKNGNADRLADVKGEQVRKDITDGQAGVKMTLAIQVVDYKTCQVVPNAYVDIWSSNSTVRPHLLYPDDLRFG